MLIDEEIDAIYNREAAGELMRGCDHRVARAVYDRACEDCAKAVEPHNDEYGVADRCRELKHRKEVMPSK